MIKIVRLAVWLSLVILPATASAGWRAGAAKITITPEIAMPMAGYASRGGKVAEGKLTELWAKAVALKDDDGERFVLITLDLIGIDRELSRNVCRRLQTRHGLKRSQIVLNASHTHTGPVVATTLRPMHYLLLDAAAQRQVDAYAVSLVHKIEQVVGVALKNLSPAELSWGSGVARFAVNRRNNVEAKAPALRAANALVGPVDHDVPVLAVHKENKLVTVVFGYACHCTVLSSFEWSGDYAGFAQIELEKTHPDCIAMFWAGCGADQNPLPRRKVEYARQYGRELAAAVENVLSVPAALSQLKAEGTATYNEIKLPLGRLPSEADLQRDLQSTNKFVRSRAEYLIQKLKQDGKLDASYPYPTQTWRLGGTVTMIFLGGEVVVDYAIALKAGGTRQGGKAKHVWVAGYSNDVMAYIPSRRVLREGGYEGGGAMVYYGLPAPWDAAIEKMITQEISRQLK